MIRACSECGLRHYTIHCPDLVDVSGYYYDDDQVEQLELTLTPAELIAEHTGRIDVNADDPTSRS